MSSRPDRVSLTAGLVMIAMGALLLLDQSGEIDLTLGLVGAIASGAIGAILVASGLGERGAGEDGG